MKRTNRNGTLRLENVGQEVTLCGWVQKRRNLGSLVFMDLRDRSGLVQLVFDESHAESVKDVRNEYVLQVVGLVEKRKDANPHMPTGEIEVLVSSVKVINTAETTPMIVADETDALEDTRLKYRYLDLRRPVLQKNLILRSKICAVARNYLASQDFIEIETPILCRSTPEGARDYLVPSRVFNGEFYALPQSPQIYKQLLMIGGMERYYQIARCFRDEDLRADRQPEFTQIDIEMSFVEEEDVWQVVEGLMSQIYQEVKGMTNIEFPRLRYDECIERFGTDKPDLRFGMELVTVNDLFANSEFQVFKNCVEASGRIVAMNVVGQAEHYSRKKLDELQEQVKQAYGIHGLAYLKISEEGITGSVAKVLSDAEKEALVTTMKASKGDILFIIADTKKKASAAMGSLRVKLAKEHDLMDKDAVKFVWVTEFPMFEYSEEEKRYVAAHHPFTAPRAEDEDKLMSDPEHCYSRAYDLVLNGYELLSGSIRIHDQALQEKVFESIGLSMDEAKQKFGFFLDAFHYGTPPHGGVGIGLERLTMILAGTDNIRDVVAFPKTASANDLMADAPNTVDTKQLDELGIQLKK